MRCRSPRRPPPFPRKRPATLALALANGEPWILVSARRLARNTHHRGTAAVDADDLAQVGRLALMLAYNAHNPELPWAPFVMARIRNAMIDMLRLAHGRRSNLTQRPVSIQFRDELHDAAVPEGEPPRLDTAELVALIASELTARERWVIRAYFTLGWRPPQIAAGEGVTDSRVSQIKTGALAKLRKAAELREAGERA